MKFNFLCPLMSICWSFDRLVGGLVGWLDCHNFPKGREVTFRFSFILILQEFVRTTNTGDSVKGRVLAVSGDLAAALALKEDPQLCLAKVVGMQLRR